MNYNKELDIVTILILTVLSSQTDCYFTFIVYCILMSVLLGSKQLKCHPEFISGSIQNPSHTPNW